MIRPCREKLSGLVEVDEALFKGLLERVKGVLREYPSILTIPENPADRSFGGKIYWGRFELITKSV
jgi:hypothetical protein